MGPAIWPYKKNNKKSLKKVCRLKIFVYICTLIKTITLWKNAVF